MNYEKSFEDLKKSILELKEENKLIPIIVEGEKDVEALYKLDINGTIITINSGLSIPDFCDKIANEYQEIIILTDWDRKGGFLCHTIIRNLEGRVVCNTRYREIFAKNTMIKTVEGLPSWISTMNEKLRI
ncbi:MAG: toprim domain-containing protein [Thermoplasmatales archaeon]|jgi:5S rRNA maturation endonuclease (ribonuclease M5)|nr:MAG: toprim domain-containing protein [Thermoplasmatales archaeon]